MKIFVYALSAYSDNVMFVVVQNALQFDKGTVGNLMPGRKQHTSTGTLMTPLITDLFVQVS